MPRKQRELTAEEKAEALRCLDEHELEIKHDIADLEDDRKKLNTESIDALGLRVTLQILKDTLEDLKEDLVQCAKERTKLLKQVKVNSAKEELKAHGVPKKIVEQSK
jgi:hypothetical protein